MSVRIKGIDQARLQLSGIIEAVLDLPYRAIREGFTLAFSDGTLVRGDYDYASRRCAFSVLTEGAGIVSITRSDGGDVLEIGWTVEWVSLASGDDTLCPGVDDVAADDDQLVLEIGSRQAA